MNTSYFGYCNVCCSPTNFIASDAWFRDFLICKVCQSIPRERAILKVLSDWYPGYKDMAIHESSPALRGASQYLRTNCPNYSTSQYLPHCKFGTTDNSTGYRSENLEALTFPAEHFDIFITQDVMEHIFNPLQASKEIARVLKPGGAHIFTVPLINKAQPTERWAAIDSSGTVQFLKTPEYHGNPVDSSGSLVTMHYGYDLAGVITTSTDCPTTIVQIDMMEFGIRAEYIEVLVMQKPQVTDTCAWS
jgi:SAM-dependent methyltransferase